MSFDLYIDFEPAVKKADFIGFLQERGNYAIKYKDISYNNEATGVYFAMRYELRNDLGDSEVVAKSHVVINYFKPSFFGLEAQIEITALLNQFPGRIHDPQKEGMGDGPYSPAGFVRSWNAGNGFGTGVVLAHRGDVPVLSRPSAQLRESWRWNYLLAARKVEYGEAQYVPEIMYFAIAGQARTLVVWGEGLPALLPKVDFVLVGRPQGAQQVFGLASWRQLTEMLNAAGYQSGKNGFDLNYATVPKPIIDFVEGTPLADLSGFTRLEPEKVLDEELVAQARALQNR